MIARCATEGCGSFEPFGSTEPGPGGVDSGALERLEVRNCNAGLGATAWEPSDRSVTGSFLSTKFLSLWNTVADVRAAWVLSAFQLDSATDESGDS